MHKVRFITLFFLFCFVLGVESQELPPINLYTTEDYGAENQNWDITQGVNKFIYVANNEGLLEYDGEDWHLYPTPNETIMRSVAYFNNKVYSGFYMDFGFWEKNNYGRMQFTSLVDKAGIQMKEDEQIWEIEELDAWLVFKSLSRIYLFNTENNEIKIIEGNENITKLSKVENTIYFQEINKGLYEIENGNALLISDHQKLRENKIVNIFYKNQRLYIITQKAGIYYLENDQLVRWNLPENSLIQSKTIYSAAILDDNSIVLGTISSGLIHLNEKGELISQIDQNNGLNNNTVLKVYEDIDHNLWLGLDNGINVINKDDAIKIYTQENNFWGTIYSTILFEGNLFIGTNQGLYFKSLNEQTDFSVVKGTEGQVWNLQNIDGALFCSHDSGTFQIENSKAVLISDIEGTWGLQKISEKLMLQGNYDGLYVLKKENNNWKLRNKIEGFSNSSKFFVLKGNDIYVNHEYKGVFRVKVNKEFTRVLDLRKDSVLEKGIHSSLISYRNKILYASKNGVYFLNENNDLFEKDTVFSKLIPSDNFLSARLIYDDDYDKLWSFTNQDIRYITSGKLTNNPILQVIPIRGAIHKGASGYENIIGLTDKNYLIGASKGYITLNLDALKPPTDYEVQLTSVFKNQIDGDQVRMTLAERQELSNSENNLAFYFSVPDYNKASSHQYQYKLEGLNEKWSPFTEVNNVLYENLPSGEYSFKVRALLDNEYSNNIASFDFIIAKPWYFSTIALLSYIIIILSLAYTWHVFSRKFYFIEKERELRNSQREFELKELENQQKIIKLNNEKLRDDIENKNRELASSTMSIIKKNEFLNTIKNELISGGKDGIDRVIRIIDKNLNNTDDWKLFQEAFNNVDKAFLKKIKDKHPGLTPNDLRLCAYLRLNLSSKEIAPLLNISPRSVEVKRYRLRKKMNLEHNKNLTNYILEV